MSTGPPVIDAEKTVHLTMSPALAEELQGLLQFNKLYDVIIIDCTLEGFLFPAEDLLKICNCAGELLNTAGSLVFAKAGEILVVTKETSPGDFSFRTFSSLGQLYDFSVSLARHVQADDSASCRDGAGNTDISDQIIMSTIPVLTEAGINFKAKSLSSPKRKVVLRAIDNYSSISAIVTRLLATHSMSVEELKDELRYLEKDQLIYPIFSKVRFLAGCLRNGTRVTIKDYLLASGLITKEQLDELLMERPSANPDARLGLGPLCVSRGYFPSRLLEIIMYELAIYGGSSQKQTETMVNPVEQSLVGQLGNTDPAGLLQNMSSERRSGVLTVEYNNRQFQCVYDQGRIIHAKLGEICGDDALIEFVATWHQGIFVFMQRESRPDLVADACKLKRPLDKLLLTAALASDSQEAIWKKLSNGINTVVEKLPDPEGILQRGNLADTTTGQQLSQREIEVMNKLWQASDGLSSISSIMRNIGNITTTEVANALEYLLQVNLITVPGSNVSEALQRFRQIAYAAGTHIGTERNAVMLKISLQSMYGYSTASRLFIVSSIGEVGIDLGVAQSAGFAASQIVKWLEDWQVKYVECLCQEMDRDLLKNIVYRVHGRVWQGSYS